MFLNELEARKVAEGGSYSRARWRLLAPLAFESETVRIITVPTDFETDFASVPRVPFAYWLTGDSAHASAVIHDYLCREWYPVGKITWARAADIFGEAMKAEGVPAWRRAIMVRAVKWFGEPSSGRKSPWEAD